MDADPAHVAIIPDGNGRWAQQRGLPRSEGHRRGVQAVREAVEFARKNDIKVLTLFCFSSENWSRPRSEISELFRLLRYFVRRELAELHKAGVRISILGELAALDDETRQLLVEAVDFTANNTKLRLCVALNYGALTEIVNAVTAITRRVEQGQLTSAQISEELLRQHLSVPDVPDPDLIIRTSGEQRLSNFMLWQAAYAEFYFPDVLWPDFNATHFEQALQNFRKRNRRFGGLSKEAV